MATCQHCRFTGTQAEVDEHVTYLQAHRVEDHLHKTVGDYVVDGVPMTADEYYDLMEARERGTWGSD